MNMMKKSLLESLICAVLACGMASTNASGAEIKSVPNGGPFPAPLLVQIAADAIYAPPGFDDNDNAQIVVHGSLDNTCFKAAPPLVETDRANHLIKVTAQAHLYDGGWCLQIVTPFTYSVDLGILKAGHYHVVEYNAVGGLLHEASLPIAVSISAAADDFLYAPVKSVRLDTSGPKRAVILNGTFASDCMEMQEVTVLHRVKDVIEVLPVATYKSDRICQLDPRPFEVRVELPEVTPGQKLIHVRSLNGQAINLVEDL